MLGSGWYWLQGHELLHRTASMLNLKKWNSLSAEVQKLITDVVMEFEERSEPGGPKCC